MQKPDGSDKGPHHHHYALHLAHTWQCEHTCQADQPSALRAMRGAGAHPHKNNKFHANHEELKKLPSKGRCKQIAEELRQELFDSSDLLPPSIYAAIWNQYQQALAALD